MHSRTGRFLLLAVLFIVGAAAAVFTVYLARRVEDLGRAEQAMAARVDALLAAVQKINDAQQAYVVPRAIDRRTVEQVPTLIEQVVKDANGIARQARAPRSAETLKRFVEGARALAQLESRAQEHIRNGRDLIASEVVSVEARGELGSMTAALRDLRSAEGVAIESDRLATLNQAWLAIGGAASLWIIGLFALVGQPRAGATSQPESQAPTVPPLSEPQEPSPPALTAATDLGGAADVCTAIGRLTDSRDLPPLLTQASAALGASGIVVWMAAGDELIVASAHGYDAKALARLGPIHRASLNATAAAWRLGAMQIVPSDEASRGALVAPMLGTDRCVGVLAVEVPPGREHDGMTQAVTRLLAAQLSATLAPWPAASAADIQPSLENAKA
ncbi:MAG TPA: hypothetical protein VKB50_20890 [Vicinamibacterales bacterium]|nr:hypothetical protein [Vicinamibacterales bacterium]